MSTRSQILFVNGKDKVLVYRHSDGYPADVIPDLIGFLRWNMGRNSDIEYTIANYFYYFKRASEEYFMTESKTVNGKIERVKRKGSPVDINDKHDMGLNFVQAGDGLCIDNKIHGDIEYFYKVHFIEGSYKIQAYKIDDGDKYTEPSDISKDLLLWDLDFTDSELTKGVVRDFFEPKQEEYKKGTWTMYADTHNFDAVTFSAYGKNYLNNDSHRKHGVLSLNKFKEMIESEGWKLEKKEEQTA
ncbi:MAG: hypothetical protein WBW34_10200 [Nitrososphaeraceae archaeon]